ncbi:MAG: HRDC domain-containing protein, partial [Zoogloeaceae bacterium]|nr:HRDC domain-containing protein [Zoogloeaceae bacterium]
EQKRATFLADLAPAAQSLFARLRQWRAETAKAQGVPAYIIFQDRTLKEIAEQRPETHTALIRILGVGEAKANRYGEQILALTKVGQGAGKN